MASVSLSGNTYGISSGNSSVASSGIQSSGSPLLNTEVLKSAIREVLSESETGSQMSDVTPLSTSQDGRVNAARTVLQTPATRQSREAELRAKMSRIQQEYNQHKAELAAMNTDGN